jgi:L-fuculose-phosphate aldolase
MTDDAAVKGARQAVLETALKLADRGFLAGVGGNLALRIDDRRLAVTPSATDYYSMTAEDVCVVDLHSLRLLAGTRTPSVESGLHAKVLARRPDCRASVHTHQPIASAFTLLGISLPVQEAALRAHVGGDVPVAGYAPSGTGWLARNVARLVRPQQNAYLMRNHGVVCLGATLDDACAVVLALERAASDWFERHGKSAIIPGTASSGPSA